MTFDETTGSEGWDGSLEDEQSDSSDWDLDNDIFESDGSTSDDPEQAPPPETAPEELSDRQQRLLEGQTARDFARLVDGLGSEADIPDAVLEKLREALSEWPASERVAPVNWAYDVVDELDARPWSLARVVSLPAGLTDDEFTRFLETAPLESAVELQVSMNSLTSRHIDRLVEAATPENFRRLSLRHSQITADALANLFDSQLGPALEDLCILGGTFGTGGPEQFDALIERADRINLETLTLGVHAEIAADALTDLLTSEAVDSLKRLELKNPYGDPRAGLPPEVSVKLANSPHLSDLRELVVSAHPLDPRAMKELGRSDFADQLEELSLDSATLGPDDLEALGRETQLPSLETLDLSQNPIRDAGLELLLENLSLDNLTALELNECDLHYDGLERLASAPALKDLTRLSVGSGNEANEYSPRVARALAEASFGAELQHLALPGWTLGPEDVSNLLEADLFDDVSVLHLGNNAIGDEGLQALLGAQFGQLRYLDLGHNGISDEGAANIARTDAFEQLEYLLLWGNEIGDRGASSLGQSELTSQCLLLNLTLNEIGPPGAGQLLQGGKRPPGDTFDLRLAENNLGSAGLKAMVEEGNLEVVDSLDLKQNGIGSGGLEALAQSEAFSEVSFIDLRSNEIGPEGARALAESPHTSPRQQILLDENPLGFEGVEMLLGSSVLDEETEEQMKQQLGLTGDPEGSAEQVEPVDPVEPDDYEPKSEVSTGIAAALFVVIAVLVLSLL